MDAKGGVRRGRTGTVVGFKKCRGLIKLPLVLEVCVRMCERLSQSGDEQERKRGNCLAEPIGGQIAGRYHLT